MDFVNSLASVTKDMKEAMTIIADNMIDTRPRGELVYHPYRKNDVYKDQAILGPRKVDLKVLYPDAKPGNVVYVSTIFESVADYDAKLNMVGNVKAIFNGETIYDYEDNPGDTRRGGCPIHLKQGDNPITFMVRCDSEDSFEFEFMPSVRIYWMWAKDYILHVRATSPIECFTHEDGVGISKLYEKEEALTANLYIPPSKKREMKSVLTKYIPMRTAYVLMR